MNLLFKKLFSKNKIAKIDYIDKKIYICCNTEKESKLRVNCCKREPDTIKFIENKLSKKSLFVDVGANVGTYSLIASSIHGNECLSIEPAYFNYISLIKNIEINKLTNKIYPINAAISDSVGITNIYFTANLSGSALHQIDKTKDNLPNGYQFVSNTKIATLTIDSVLKEVEYDDIFVKVDVDGAEKYVLDGSIKTLKEKRIQSMLIEVNNTEKRNIVSFMNHFGYYLESTYEFPNNISSNIVFSIK